MSQVVNISKVDILVDQYTPAGCLELENHIASLRHDDAEYNLWNYPCQALDNLKIKFESMANQLLANSSNQYTRAVVDRAWEINYDDGGYIAPHYHGGSFITGILYLSADPGSGDLLIQDPLVAYNWRNLKNEKQGHDGSASIHITPETGKMIVMPGFLIHSTEPNPVGLRRHVFSTNFNLVG